MRQLGWALTQYDQWCPYKRKFGHGGRDAREVHARRQDQVRTWREGARLQAKERYLRGKSAKTLILNF